MLRPIALILLIAPLAPSQETRPASRPADAPEGGTLVLEVVWQGDQPEPPEGPVVPPGYTERFPESGRFCSRCEEQGRLRHEGLLISGKGGVRNVAVSFPRLESAKGPSSAVVDNASCRFAPRVQFAPVGRPVLVKNSDPVTHNARLRPLSGGRLANLLVPPGRSSATPPVPRPGIYVVTCDLHPWMRATVIAARNPWCAVTGEDGRAVIRGVPEGEDHFLAVWHERLGTARRTVEIEAGATLRLRLTQKDFSR